jgi:protease-4
VQELRQGLARVRGAGKFVIGFAESFGGTASHVADYYLATALEQVWLQPSGSFAITGLAVETPFVRGSLDKLGVRIEGGKRHEYKSMPDSFTRTGFSGPARDNLQQLVDGLYRQFLFDAARDRRMEADRLRALIDTAPLTADQTLREGLVDKLGYRDEALDEVWRRAGTGAQAVTLEEYADHRRTKPAGEIIALVRVNGPIASNVGSLGPFDDDALTDAHNIAHHLLEAAQAKDVRAIVLRIDSPGGTYPASDTIAAAVAKVRAAGKPVVVSMGDVAASGGYLAAVAADVIVAEPTSITGSIGVFGIHPVATDLLESLGVKVERVGAGANAGMYSFFQPPTDAQRALLDRELDLIYADFTRKVGENRKLDGARLDAAARGRVFTGADAQRAGLVDELGGLSLAINIARAKAGIAETRPVQVKRFPAESDRLSRLVERLLGLSSVEVRAPSIRAPRELREALLRFGIVTRPGNVRLPPLPPLWR